MWIERLHIEGFGLHHELRLALAPGLNVLLGPNEAGKSTLHAFVGAMLHGLPRGVSHEPLAGGRHGGALVLARGEERIRVERSFSPKKTLRVRGAGGEELSESALAHLLGNVDEALYRNVFAFDLDDLQELGLGSDEIERRLFDAGLLGAGRSLVAIRKELRTEKDEVLRPRSGPIREMHRALAEKRRELAELVQRSRGHGERIRGVEALERAIEAAKEKRGRLRAAERSRAHLLALWPDEVERRGLEKRLEELPAARGSVSLWEEALSRFDRLQERERTHREQLVRLDREAEELGGRIEALAIDEAQLQKEPDLLALEQERGSLEEARAGLSSLATSIAEKEARMVSLLQSLGPSWSIDRAREVDRSLARREALASLAEELAGARAAWEEAEREAKAARANADAAGLAVEAAREVLADHGEVADAASLEARARALATLRASWAERDRRVGETGRPSWPHSLRMVGTFLLALAAAGVFLAGERGAGVALLAVALALSWMWGRAGRRAPESSRDGSESEWKEAARTLGLASDPRPADVEGAGLALERDRGRFARHEDLARQLGEREERAHLARAEAARREEAAEEERKRWEEVRARWAAHCHDLGGEGLGADAARERLDRVERAVATWELLEGERRERERIQARVDGWVERARRLLGESSGEESTLALALLRLRQEIDAERARAEERRALEERRESAERSLGQLRGQIEEVAAEAAGCLAEHGVASREALVEGLGIEREREDIANALRRIEAAFLERIGEGEEAARIRRELGEGRRDDWEAELAETREAIEAIDADLERLQREHTILLREQKEEEVSDAIPALAERIEAEKAAWGELIHRYRKAAILELLLDDALEELQESRQPAVLRSASAFFRVVTDGRYVQIRQMREAQQVEVLRPEGEALSATALSRGTREQLYLCLRLGLADAFAEQGTKLPLLLDDVLVNFDPDRARAMARVLADAAERHQLLLFTCHPATAALLESEARANRLSLGGAGSEGEVRSLG